MPRILAPNGLNRHLNRGALWSLLMICSPLHAFTLDFPTLDLNSTADEVRHWAQENDFQPVTATPPMDEVYQKEFNGAGRHVLSFVEGSNGLKLLAYDQFGILNSTAAVRRNIVEQFGAPSADQILPGRTLRITYVLDDPPSARRIFLITVNSLSMMMATNAYFTELQKNTAAEEQAEQAAAQAAKEAAEAAESRAAIEARNAWLIPLLWIVGVGLAWIVFLRLAPEPIRRPVVKVVGTAFGAVYGLVNEIFFQLFPIALGIALFGALVLSGLAVFVGPVELGTSWWWVLLWLAGLAMMYKSHDDGSMKTALLSLGFYIAGLCGVMLEIALSGG